MTHDPAARAPCRIPPAGGSDFADGGSAYETAFGAYGNPSLQLFAALADLAEVLQETGSPDYEAVFLRAHEVDDAIQDEPDPNDAITEGGSDEKQDHA